MATTKFYKDSNGIFFIGDASYPAGVYSANFSENDTKVTITNVMTGEELKPVALITSYTTSAGVAYADRATFSTALKDFFVKSAGNASGVEVVNALGYTPEDASKKGASNGYAPLDSASKVPAANLPSALAVGAISNQGSYDSAKALSGIAISKELGTHFKFANSFILSNGSIGSDGSRTCTDYLRITTTEDIVFYGESNNMYVNALSFYDKNKTYISGICNNQTTVAIQTILAANIPSNAVYVRLSTTSSLLANSFVFFGGMQSLIQKLESIIGTIADSVAGKLSIVYGKNLFDKSTVVDGSYLGGGGSIGTNPIYFYSALIPVTPNTTYTHSGFLVGGAYCYCYDINKAYISGADFRKSTVTTPANCYYVKMSGVISGKDTQQFELGSSATNYEAFTIYGFMSNVLNQVHNRDVVCILPKNMYFVKGKQSNIYYENVLLKNLNDPTSLYFDKGTNYNRQVAFNFGSSATSQIMVAQVVRSLKKGQSKAITYNVVDPATNNGKTVNALHIGDSFTDIGTWVKEIKTLLNAQGVTYNPIGTCGDSTFRAEGLSGGTLANTFLNSSAGVGRRVAVTGVTTLPSTGYPGRTYRDSTGKDWTIRSGKIDGSGNGYLVVTKYGAVESDFSTFPASGALTKQGTGEGDATINYSSPTACYFNPFINPSTGLLDISNYLATWVLSTPNVVAIQFTWNDLDIWASDTTINALVDSFKTAADHIHTALPSAKVVFSIEPCGSINGNRDWNGKKYSVLRFTELMLAQFEDNSSYNTWVKIAPSYAFVDLVNGYSGGNTVAPCDRYPTVTEASGGDGVHPNTGMYQIADCVSQVISNII